MVSSISNFTNEQTAELKTKNKGIVRAYFAPKLITAPAAVLSGLAVAGMRKVSSLNDTFSKELSNATEEGLKISGLKDKGVKVFKMNEMNFGEFVKNIKEAIKNRTTDNLFSFFTKEDKKAIAAMRNEILPKSKLSKMDGLSKLISKLISKPVAATQAAIHTIPFKLGINAGYLPKANKIITPDKHLMTSVFHEMGHALNANGGRFLKGLQKMRPLAMFAPPLILLTSIFNKKKATDDTPAESKIGAFFNFTKRHAGKLTALAMLPMIAEESIASLRGGKLAKNLFKDGKLSKTLLNKIRLTNAAGFATYALGMAAAVAAVKFAIHVKDSAQAKHEAEVLNNAA